MTQQIQNMYELNRLISTKWMENTLIHKLWSVNGDNVEQIFKKACQCSDAVLAKALIRLYMQHVRYDCPHYFVRIEYIFESSMEIRRIFLDNVLADVQNEVKRQQYLSFAVHSSLMIDGINPSISEQLELYIEYGFVVPEWLMFKCVREKGFLPFFIKHSQDMSRDDYRKFLIEACGYRNSDVVKYLLGKVDLTSEDILICTKKLLFSIFFRKGEECLPVTELLFDSFKYELKNEHFDQIMMMFLNLNKEFNDTIVISMLKCVISKRERKTLQDLSKYVRYMIRKYDTSYEYIITKYLISEDESKQYDLYVVTASHCGSFNIAKHILDTYTVSQECIMKCIDISIKFNSYEMIKLLEGRLSK